MEWQVYHTHISPYVKNNTAEREVTITNTNNRGVLKKMMVVQPVKKWPVTLEAEISSLC
jgi:hypothetical protein